MITIRPATPDDSAALIQLTAITPMQGDIGLRIDRHPDFFHLLRERGTFVALVAETEDNQVVGSFTACRQAFVVEQVETPVYYLGDLKVHPKFAGSTVAFRLVHQMYSALKGMGADLLFCTAAEGNNLVKPFFSGKAEIPPFRKLSCFRVYQILPREYGKEEEARSLFTLSELTAFYDSFNERYTLFPRTQNLHACEHFVMKRDGKIIAAVSTADTSAFKQNVLMSYSPTVGFLLGALKVLRPILRMSRLPEKGAAVRVLYVRCWATSDESGDALRTLIRQAGSYAYGKGYHFLSMAVDEKDAWTVRLMKGFRSFVFYSNGLLTSLQHQTELLDRLCQGMSYEDYSIV